MTHRWIGWLIRATLGVSMLVTIMPVRARAMSEGIRLIDPADPTVPARMELVGSRIEAGKLDVVTVREHPKLQKAIRLTTFRDPGVEWGLQAMLRVDAGVERGDVLLARFWMRCVDSMTGEGFTGFVFEQNHEPYEKAAELRVGATGEWAEIFVPFRAAIDYPAGSAQILFRGGYDRQTIEIGGIELTNYGKTIEIEQLPRTQLTYAGRAADAPWRAEALQRIERYRKADLKVKVVDRSGRPVEGAKVEVRLLRHAFGFGSCVTVDQITGDSPDSARARQIIEQHFTRVVFENDMKWPAMWNGPSAKLDESVAWLRERQIEVRGHNLHWPSWQWSPKQLQAFADDPAELRRRCAARVTDTVAHFRGKLVAWDVVNEPYNNVDLLNILGKEVMVDWFRLADQADPDAALYINDFGIFDGGTASEHRRHFYETIRTLREAGAPVEGIGIQSHFGAVLPPPTQLLAVLDQFGSFGLPIESTEFSLNTDDRKLQADYLRDYMIALFSHPKVQSIILWGFWEGRHWRPNAALWDANWNLRPHGKVWLDLVTKQWTTHQTLQTGADGAATVRGFKGAYQVTAAIGSRRGSATCTLDRDGTLLTLEVSD